MNDLWVIGDRFIHDIFYALGKLKTQASMKQKELPYMYNYFNISCFTSNPKSFERNTLARIVNCLVKALNDTVKLPRLILVVPDEDIL